MSESTPPPTPPVAPVESVPVHPPHHRPWKRIVAVIVVVIVLVASVPWLIKVFTTVSTDDAYVNGHVTFVAPRVAGQVARVLVDDNNRVRKGDLLVQLDPETFVVQVNIAQSAVDALYASTNGGVVPGGENAS